MKNLISNLNRKKYGLAAILLVLIYIIISAFMQLHQNKPIVGTWIGIHSTNTTTREVYTADGKYKFYYEGRLMTTNTYKLSNKPNPCGVDMHRRLQLYPNNKFLIFTNTKTNKKQCYLVYKLTENRLITSPFGSASVDSLKKVQ